MTPESLCKSGLEFGEQSALFCWLNSAETRQRFPILYNEENKRCKVYGVTQNFTDPVKGARAKQIGIQSGVPDIFVPLARHGVHGLYIELKIDPEHPVNKPKKKKNGASDEQKQFGRQVIKDGFGWCVACGWQAAKEIIEQYLQ